MADSDQILQLGIEEARNGNRDEARNLFELLTRQEPNNAQAWLWLAGVADNPDQRRAALQRVLELDPGNDMARKGLQAMGVATTVTPAEPVAEVVPPIEEPVAVPVEPDRPRSADEDFADQLDSAFDDYDALPRAQAPVRREETLDEEGGARVTTERPSVRSSRLEFDDEDDEPVRRGPHPLLWVLVALIGAVLLGFIVLSLMGGGGGGTVGRPTSEATSEIATPAPGEATTVPGVGEQPTTEGATPGEATNVPGVGEQP
ncbi:MAG TPA: tetratricopeptide repeat protein, partial [Roseiflexaceae bacterium]|nr:tetratricopeptide repeat protein [Roseiflexaceae bacterium]